MNRGRSATAGDGRERATLAYFRREPRGNSIRLEIASRFDYDLDPRLEPVTIPFSRARAAGGRNACRGSFGDAQRFWVRRRPKEAGRNACVSS